MIQIETKVHQGSEVGWKFLFELMLLQSIEIWVDILTYFVTCMTYNLATNLPISSIELQSVVVLRAPEQNIATSSKWPQLCDPIPRFAQERRQDSFPVQPTLSSQIWPEPDPNLQRKALPDEDLLYIPTPTIVNCECICLYQFHSCVAKYCTLRGKIEDWSGLALQNPSSQPLCQSPLLWWHNIVGLNET